MDPSSRAPAPPPLKLGPVRASTSPASGTPGSGDSAASRDSSGHGYYYASPFSASGAATPLLRERNFSSGSSSSDSSAGFSSMKKIKTPRKVNANSYCGRHSDEYLFGGKGFGDLWRAVTKK
ncbi:hypothetical protein N656DRAFT_795973 [Canariomyces notabilis]|uniref:Uncharacterized protein n=1 Tax=Canariomyces notabilis TaxID=2074819 RepID=A0AAN6YVH4_9PEZI|nr:hypothetical protein N656DRAFT_795973 [Canariomyces arenarius]